MKTQGIHKLHFMAQAGMIAAIYAVLTYAAAAMNLAYGAVQFRFSEALTLLPVMTPAAIPGLAIGCFLANLASPLGPVDWVFGTAASLMAAVLSYLARNLRIKSLPVLSMFFPVLCNAVIIGLEIVWVGVMDSGTAAWAEFLPTAISVGAGELAVCAVLGLPLTALLERSGTAKKIFCC